jgi:CRP-like cAMP-binding protein
MFKVLENKFLFKGISVGEVENIFRDIKFQVRSFSKDSIVSYQGDEYKHLLILVSGSVRGEMTSSTDKVINIEDLYPPSPLAFVYLFGSENKIPVDIIANEDCEVLFIPKSEVLKIVASNSQFSLNYLNALADKANFLANKIKFLNLKVLKAKIAQYILNHAKQENTVVLVQTQQQIAESLAVTRSSLAREFANLEKVGVIKLKNKTIEILKKSALIMMANVT